MKLVISALMGVMLGSCGTLVVQGVSSRTQAVAKAVEESEGKTEDQVNEQLMEQTKRDMAAMAERAQVRCLAYAKAMGSDASKCNQ